MKDEIINSEKDEIINSEIATLAKEKGFEQNHSLGVVCRIGNKINKDYEEIREIKQSDLDNSWSILNEVYPTQSVLQRWLREKYSQFVLVDMTINREYYCKYFNKTSAFEYTGTFSTYEEALEVGLYKSLKLI